ncbi:hypothetical protein WA026_005748 [Henosepilachna vigintioctopunctata]|uniref:Uncharacterized protein n=1 Tax=Henosepilachna vigintioctopunctata TaxID=420089 RepID=A0AAW1TTR8_9CUCU
MRILQETAKTTFKCGLNTAAQAEQQIATVRFPQLNAGKGGKLRQPEHYEGFSGAWKSSSRRSDVDAFRDSISDRPTFGIKCFTNSKFSFLRLPRDFNSLILEEQLVESIL